MNKTAHMLLAWFVLVRLAGLSCWFKFSSCVVCVCVWGGGSGIVSMRAFGVMREHQQAMREMEETLTREKEVEMSRVLSVYAYCGCLSKAQDLSKAVKY